MTHRAAEVVGPEHLTVVAIPARFFKFSKGLDGTGRLGSWTAFTAALIGTAETTIFVRRGGSGPAVLLLHGFPQAHLMWRDGAPRPAPRFTVVCADLRGYGRSGCPVSTPDHAPYTKRAMRPT